MRKQYMYLKKLVLIFLSVLFVIPINLLTQSSGWQMQESGTDNHLMDVFFINADTGWIAGYDCILKTTNGGLDWEIQDSTKFEFWAIHFTNADCGFAVGYKPSGAHGFIYQTTNGGQDWYLKDSSDYELNDICFVDSDTGFAVGGGRSQTTILKTTDGGENWETIYDAYGRQLYTVDFVDLKTGWAAGERGRISKTTNGFKEMESITLDIGNYNFYKIDFTNPDTGWVICSEYILGTTNGGDNWQPLALLADHSYRGCFFKNGKSGWVGAYELYPGSNNIIYTSDGGTSWQIQDTTLKSPLYSIFFIDDYAGWAVGPDGMIMFTTNGGIVNIENDNLSHIELPYQFILNQNYPNPFNPVTVISWQLVVSSHVELNIYNILGQRVATLVNKKQPAGSYQMQWDASGFTSGVYLYRLSADNGHMQTKKMILLR